MKIDFIGIGAQRCATSWIYSCLYDHPEICAPQKEIHFFSRPRYEEQGLEWYVNKFAKRCNESSVKGEYSTSYLYHEKAAVRIKKHFPDVKIIVALREPVARAYSQYQLHAQVGWLKQNEVSFEEFIKQEKSALEQGLYYEQLKRYFDLFGSENILVVLQEDIDIDKQAFISRIYGFLGVQTDFVPALLQKRINRERTPRLLCIDKIIRAVSGFLYRNGLDPILFTIKKSGIPKMIRKLNTKQNEPDTSSRNNKELKKYFIDDIAKTSELVDIDLLKRWNYEA